MGICENLFYDSGVTMQDHLLSYFAGEKSESLLFLIIGAAAILFGAYLLLTNSHFKSMAYPVIFIAIIQLIAGGTVYFRTDAQIDALSAEMKSSPFEFRAHELTRMKTVTESFRLYKLVEILLFAAGILITYLFADHAGWYFAGVGLAAQSALMLLADLFAEYRALVYIPRLQEFVPQIVQ